VNTLDVSLALQKAYVVTMMDVIARGLVSTSAVDEDVQAEIRQFPTNFVIQMTVLPSGPGFALHINDDHSLTLLKNFSGRADLSIKFKHISHAFLVFSFQEGTARAFANDRMIADGDIGHAIRLVRCLNKMEALILPKAIASLAVKRYPDITLGEKIIKAGRIYSQVARNFVLGK
jgi:hypothetical protein